jgi:hypothetical protein
VHGYERVSVFCLFIYVGIDPQWAGCITASEFGVVIVSIVAYFRGGNLININTVAEEVYKSQLSTERQAQHMLRIQREVSLFHAINSPCFLPYSFPVEHVIE